ncbi:hypothetical protein [Micromonospora sp. NBC_00617]|uniref:hypothetical protein n=1 Tax=Micromonospora sp. NBC_00617 TaxID=2903587 RepID=UPI0030DF0E56
MDEFPSGVEHRLAELFDAVLPVPVTLDRVVVLDGSAPLVWLVRPTPALTALHAAVWVVLDQADGHRPWHAPGAWAMTPPACSRLLSRGRPGRCVSGTTL